MGLQKKDLLKEKVRLLEALYRRFEDFLPSGGTACRKGCDTCCTLNVTITTLEGYSLLKKTDAVKVLEKQESRLRAEAHNRYRPRTTINEWAEVCAAGEAPAEEATPDPGSGSCPLLKERLCTVYPARPFGCRCMVSKRCCAETGFADMEDFHVTVSTVFQQLVEHLDADGCTGNLVDVLLAISRNGDSAPPGASDDCRAFRLLPNRPLSVLMVPPEHRERIAPLLAELRSIGYR